MKRNKTIGIAMVLALTLALVVATAAFAQGPAGTRDGVRDFAGNGAAFVDEDGDGVCDNAGEGVGHAWGFVDENSDGVNDNFVDADGDGVCDNEGQNLGYGRTAKGSTAGQGAGTMQRGQSKGMRGASFVDADGNGICDLLEQ